MGSPYCAGGWPHVSVSPSALAAHNSCLWPGCACTDTIPWGKLYYHTHVDGHTHTHTHIHMQFNPSIAHTHHHGTSKHNWPCSEMLFKPCESLHWAYTHTWTCRTQPTTLTACTHNSYTLLLYLTNLRMEAHMPQACCSPNGQQHHCNYGHKSSVQLTRTADMAQVVCTVS